MPNTGGAGQVKKNLGKQQQQKIKSCRPKTHLGPISRSRLSRKNDRGKGTKSSIGIGLYGECWGQLFIEGGGDHTLGPNTQTQLSSKTYLPRRGGPDPKYRGKTDQDTALKKTVYA